MPSTSVKQEKFMRAIAHGWKPTRIKDPPSRAVATEFMEADRKYAGGFAENRYYTGGLAAMNMQEGGAVNPIYGLEPMTWKQAVRATGAGGRYASVIALARLKAAGYSHSGDMWYAPETTLLGDQDGTAPPTGGYDPYYGAGPGSRDGGGRGGGRRGGGGRRRNGGGGGPGPGGGPPGPGAGPPLTDIPPYVPPPPRDPRAGRDTPMSEALRAHRQRVASSLSVPEGGYAEGGHVENYQEGGAARAGHAEGANPYPQGSARYKLWERKHHVDPAPVAQAPEAEDIGWLDRLLGRGEEYKGRTERELEELGEAHGGYIDVPGYQYGGLAAANFRGPPAGGVPPRLPTGMMNPRGGIPPYGATTGQSSLPAHLRNPGSTGAYGMQRPPMLQKPVGMMDPRGFPGGRMVPPSPPGGFPGRGGGRPPVIDGAGPAGAPGGPGGVPGGPRVPPNLRGYLQRQRMMNRPPANVGGGVNRVGQQDQQGGLARALQRGTGRPPMSRRAGFPGRNIR